MARGESGAEATAVQTLRDCHALETSRVLLAPFQFGDFKQAALVAVGLAEFGGEKGLHEVPGKFRSFGAATKAEDIEVIVFNALPGGKMVFNEAGAHAFDFVGTNGRTHAAATDSKAAVEFSAGHGLAKGDDVVGIIVVRLGLMGAKVSELMSRLKQAGGEMLF